MCFPRGSEHAGPGEEAVATDSYSDISALLARCYGSTEVAADCAVGLDDCLWGTMLVSGGEGGGKEERALFRRG